MAHAFPLFITSCFHFLFGANKHLLIFAETSQPWLSATGLPATTCCLWKVTFWKNVSGVYTADPRQVPEAFPINSRLEQRFEEGGCSGFFCRFCWVYWFNIHNFIYWYSWHVLFVVFSLNTHKVAFFVGSTGDLSSWGQAGSWMRRVHHEDFHFVLLSMEFWRVIFCDFRWSQNSWV